MSELPQNPIARSLDVGPLCAKPCIPVGLPLPKLVEEEDGQTLTVVLEAGISRPVDEIAPVRWERYPLELESRIRCPAAGHSQGIIGIPRGQICISERGNFL